MRAGELLGRTAYAPDGRRLGRVVDVVVRADGTRGRLRLTDLIVAGHWYGRVAGRLVGAEHHPSGPWLIRMTARLINRSTHQYPVERVRFDPPLPWFPTGPPADAGHP
ncbi:MULTISPECIES: hypothetical protein [Micromonospora]|uniref:PRC-barrel domain-containing protein n=1 Tax=Micromonospora yangpuensis TaxID=683228 RepID=A0A1C6UJK3_9ACTN|nr:hypothetical protein [Micromonospora yangpuensis]GGM02649.1 hypothetical protein GCM10012279_20350 [Micromonospora yangpuensis]SCL54079.1 hypothetical protein GA0070617_2556 [Micromonospora yangpuensis]